MDGTSYTTSASFIHPDLHYVLSIIPIARPQSHYPTAPVLPGRQHQHLPDQPPVHAPIRAVRNKKCHFSGLHLRRQNSLCLKPSLGHPGATLKI